MHHLAILHPKYKYLNKILSGKKSIESRWYKFRVSPWNKIKVGDTVFFKDSSKPVALKAEVSKVLQFDHLSQTKTLEVIRQYGNQITANNLNVNGFYQSVKAKNYVILIFLQNPQKVIPFKINKAGFGCSCAWISVDNINQIRLKS